jgi:hypothetical protein
VAVLVDSMRAARDGPAPSLMQTLTSAYRKSLVAAAALLLRDSDDADAAARARSARAARLPAFAQRTPAEKLLGEAFDLDAERRAARAKLAAAGASPAGLEAAAAAWQATEAAETAAAARLETLEIKMTRIVAALERLGGRPAGPAGRSGGAEMSAAGGRGSRAGGGPPFMFGSAKRSSRVASFSEPLPDAGGGGPAAATMGGGAVGLLMEAQTSPAGRQIGGGLAGLGGKAVPAAARTWHHNMGAGGLPQVGCGIDTCV